MPIKKSHLLNILLVQHRGKSLSNPNLFTKYACPFSSAVNSESHTSIPDYISKWTTHFSTCPSLFELQRGLNNCFGYDMVPPAPVLKEALLAARRLNDFPTAVRVFGALREKTENDRQYELYLDELRETMEELGICTPEDLNR